ncbi:PREDICTED: cation-dependent mannose-6-phosphate receptor-like isoform X2 [Chinchilla lanigera]|uniref:cation-dependent mannose-6-phosphate receptor-like isoform X2 n=1 Tax=Chinchilla lanigera TaxID=34839 RepID=UPI00038EA5E4|nr:PREDICTED: cation-dependent mannose-6-phosphate receptor-like isoform X2 [Chinchilla lanigera]
MWDFLGEKSKESEKSQALLGVPGNWQTHPRSGPDAKSNGGESEVGSRSKTPNFSGSNCITLIFEAGDEDDDHCDREQHLPQSTHAAGQERYS